MLLSVLSALARLDVDPWMEAATLTKMPVKDCATTFETNHTLRQLCANLLHTNCD
jgi:hypothetical protein